MSGAGTNAGIEYQQRVASLLLTYQYGELDISNLIGCNTVGHISETRFETDSPIDDIAVRCREGWAVEFQIKRSLSLSKATDSEFADVLSQFVKRFITDRNGQTYFALITTSDASGKIRYELKKILESVRLNDTGFSNNPLNKSETETLKVFSSLFEQTFSQQTGGKPNANDFTDFSKRTFISVMDVEAGMQLENAVLIVLKERGFSRPELVWSLLIKNSLHYATERMSISRNGLASLLNQYKVAISHNADPKAGKSEFFDQLKNQSVACGKEVLFAKSFDSNFDYMLVEMFRFDDSSQKRVQFKGNQVILQKSGVACEVIFRCSSIVGLERFFESAGDKFSKSRIVVMPANDIAGVEDSEAAKLYRAYFDQLIRTNPLPERCLHCSKDVIQGSFHVVEIDEPGLPAAAGVVHPECRRPLDRVVGFAQVENGATKALPAGFDLSGWIKALERGQAMMNGIRSGLIPPGHQLVIHWSSDSEYDVDYRFCVKFILANGSERHSFERGKILRLNQTQAESQVKQFTQWFEERRKAKDPYCLTSKSYMFGPYSLLIQSKPNDEEIIEIVSAEVAPYTELLSKLYNTCENYYAPMGIVRDAASESPLCLGGLVPLISDPLQFREFEKNLCDAGFGCEALTFKVIKSDQDFDVWMHTIFGDGFTPVIDPLFDKNQNLVSGFVIQHQEAMMMAEQLRRGAGQESK